QMRRARPRPALGTGGLRSGGRPARDRDHAGRAAACDGVHGPADAGLDRPYARQDRFPMSTNVSRRRALASLGAWAAASPLARAQDETPRRNLEPAGRIAPRAELVNVTEFEIMAQRKLGSDVFAAIADGDRRVFDRMIFRPRMMVDATKLDLS